MAAGLWLVVLAGACGRLGYDAQEQNSNSESDASGDGLPVVVCGDGVVQETETCDPPSTCELSACDDGSECTRSTIVGSASECNLRCDFVDITTCGADGCCLPGCVTEGDPDCTTVCGDTSCVGNAGENCATCAECNTREVICGNGECQTGESSSTCLSDCGPDPWPAEWEQAQTEFTAEINATRIAGITCPTGAAPAAPALLVDTGLDRAARQNAYELSDTGYNQMDLISCNGRTLADRAAAQGTTSNLEVSAAGFANGAAAAQWLFTTTLCADMMDPTRTFMGAGHAAPGTRFWIALFR